jgi:hypothetical protein
MRSHGVASIELTRLFAPPLRFDRVLILGDVLDNAGGPGDRVLILGDVADDAGGPGGALFDCVVPSCGDNCGMRSHAVASIELTRPFPRPLRFTGLLVLGGVLDDAGGPGGTLSDCAVPSCDNGVGE